MTLNNVGNFVKKIVKFFVKSLSATVAFAEVHFLTGNGNFNVLRKDHEKNVKAQEVKPIHKMSQKP